MILISKIWHRFECYSLENELKLHQKYRFLINYLLSKICVFNIENIFYFVFTYNKFVNKKRQNLNESYFP
jgi:hypothetical protein